MATPNKERRKLKTEPRLKISLNEEQKEAYKLFYEYDVLFLIGDFASGKTSTATYMALSSFRKKEFNKIWITRPMLKNNLAALPGTLEEKLHPYIYPILQNLEVCQGKEATQKMSAEGELEIMPIEVAKGVTFIDSIVIVDEAQDMNYQDFRTILTRLGKDSKMIFCASKQQIDEKIGRDSSFYKFEKLKGSGIVGWIELKSNHRNDILSKIIDFLEDDKG
jgi:phosphate starvation-inducible PhoH-like protein